MLIMRLLELYIAALDSYISSMNTPLEGTVRDRFFGPLKNAADTAAHSRKCHGLSDWEYLQSGVGRCLEIVHSGRDWVQRLHGFLSRLVTVSCFFKSLRSERRLRLLSEVDEALLAQCDLVSDDPLSAHAELDGFAVYAADGHYHGCSAHEEPIAGKRRAVGHFFSQNLRTRWLRHLDIARPDLAKGKKTEHDLSVLKRLEPKALRMGEADGVKVLLIYDRAVIDLVQWHKWKQGRGVYVLTRESGNMRLEVIGEYDFDRGDARNRGVVRDQMVGHSKGRMIRRVVYTDPVTGDTFRFVTNQLTLPPGLIAYLYKRRWDVEKVFDELKNRLGEGKAWGKTATAKCQQGKFLCLTHNLLLLFERGLAHEEGITDEKVLRRRRARQLRQAADAAAAGRPMNSLLMAAHAATQRSAQFLRWIRGELAYPTPWEHALSALRPLMLEYLR